MYTLLNFSRLLCEVQKCFSFIEPIEYILNCESPFNFDITNTFISISNTSFKVRLFF